jgi:hypothetical protein
LFGQTCDRGMNGWHDVPGELLYAKRLEPGWFIWLQSK